MRGFGGILTFDLEGGERAATAFAEALELVSLAPSLGGVETLISPPMHTSHAAFDPAERRALGIADGALRLSIGIEDVREILEDLDKGFRALA
jgi:cystathionine gamma-lyase